MNVPAIIDAMLADLALVAISQPNERLPKEEQIRCSIYTAIRPLFHVVCAERGYASIDDGSRIECDLWALTSQGAPVWIEFKRCWSVKGWVNKPPEQLANWIADIEKLRRLPIDTDRYFFLVGAFDCDPLCENDAARSTVASKIRPYYASHLVHRTSKPFNWRRNDGINCIGAWAWHWPHGAIIEAGCWAE